MMTTPGPKDLLSAQEVARQLGIPLPTIYHFARNNILPVTRIGGRLRFQADEVGGLTEIVRVRVADHLHELVAETESNKDGAGIFLLPKTLPFFGPEKDSIGTDIFVTDYSGSDWKKIVELQNGFSGIIIQLIKENRENEEFHGSPFPIFATSQERLAHTLREVRDMIVANRSNGQENDLELPS